MPHILSVLNNDELLLSIEVDNLKDSAFSGYETKITTKLDLLGYTRWILQHHDTDMAYTGFNRMVNVDAWFWEHHKLACLDHFSMSAVNKETGNALSLHEVFKQVCSYVSAIAETMHLSVKEP